MNWPSFFEVWAWVSGVVTFFSFIAVCASADIADRFDKRYWLVPAATALLTAIFGSLAAGLR